MAGGLLAPGTILTGADSGSTISIVRRLGGGGQGDVYEVAYLGERKALKWYRDPTFLPGHLFDTLSRNARRGSPGPSFIWPIECTEPRAVEVAPGVLHDTFGYVMDLIPTGEGGYRSFADFLLCEARFASFRVAVDACLEIAQVFRLLHARGLCYQDLSAGNFFFHPETGEVLICDCDNVAENGVTSGVLGTPGFMAPELVVDYWEQCTGIAQGAHHRPVAPNYKTDRFSMAVLFFEILTLTNPLAGRLALGPQDDAWRAALYGYDPRFMFDATSDKNAPVPGIHDNAIRVWEALPSYMRDVFLRAFSHEALHHQNARLNEGVWIDAFCRLRADILRCPHCTSQADLFCDAGSACRCGSCGKVVRPPLVFVFENGVRTPAVPGTRVFRTQVGATPIGRELDQVATMVCREGGLSDPRQWGVRNLSGERTWARVGHAQRTFAPLEVIPVAPGLAVSAFGHTFHVEINDA